MKERYKKKDPRPRKDYEREKERMRRTRESSEANGRLDDTETTEYKDAEGRESLSESEQWWLRCTVYTEAWRSGDLDSGVICETRCVVPLSRSVLHAFAKRAARSGEQSAAKGDRREEEERREGSGEERGGGELRVPCGPSKEASRGELRIETSWPLCTAP